MDDSRLQSSIVATAVESGKAMGSSMKPEGKEEGLAELFKLNQIWYRMPPTLSLVSKRCLTKCNFQQISYAAPLTQQTVSAIFNTGEFQINGKTSFLCIQAGIDKSSSNLTGIFETALNTTPELISLSKSVAHAYLGQGGIMNIVDEVTFLSASGTEVDRQQNKGLQLSHVTRNRQSLPWYNTAGESQGYPGGTFQDCYDGLGWPGFVNDDGKGGTASPWLIPTRATHFHDFSQVWINSNAVPSTSSNSNATSATTYSTTKFSGASYTGSVDVSFDSKYNATYNPNPGVAPTFVVPLCDVAGMFSPYMNALIPSQALAGGRLELRFKNMTEALVASGPSFSAPGTQTAVAGYANAAAISNANAFLAQLQIYNIYFLLDSFQLNEGTLSRLNEAAAGNEGLSLMFDTWDWTQTSVNNTSFEAQVSQARSRVIRSFCVIRDIQVKSNPYANSLASEAAVNRPNGYTKLYGSTATGSYQLLVNTYQAQMGSLYFPQQPLQSHEEYVTNAFYSFSRDYADSMETNAVSLSDFMGANGRNLYDGSGNVQAPIAHSTTGTIYSDSARAYISDIPDWAINWGSATYGFLAERSQLLQLSGLPISNARLLRHRFVLNYNSVSTLGRTVDCFTEYTRVMKVFLGGRIVMRE